MARKPMVTRTFKTTHVVFMAVNTEIGETVTQDIVVSVSFSDDKKLLRHIQQKLDTETFKVVAIVDKTDEEKLYGMTEDEFIRNAVELDPATRKAI